MKQERHNNFVRDVTNQFSKYILNESENKLLQS